MDDSKQSTRRRYIVKEEIVFTIPKMIHFSEFNPLDVTLEKQDEETYLIRYKGGDLIVNIGKKYGTQDNLSVYNGYDIVIGEITARMSVLGFRCYHGYHRRAFGSTGENVNLIVFTHLSRVEQHPFLGGVLRKIEHKALKEDI